jgi:phage baseplate assembly protein V
MDEFFDLLTLKSEKTHESFAQPRIGTVTSSNSQTATARVLLQPEGVLTGWLPVLTQWAGSGWGMACPPSPGDQVLIIPQEGDAQHGLIVGRLYSNSVRPPQVESGEIVFSHQSGCSLRLLNSGVIVAEGDLHVSGDIYDAHGSLSKLRNDYNVHTHHTNNGQVTSDPLPLD